MKWLKSFGLCFLSRRSEPHEQVFVLIVRGFEEIRCLRILLLGVLLYMGKVNFIRFYFVKSMLLTGFNNCVCQSSWWFLYFAYSFSLELLLRCVPKYIKFGNLRSWLIFCFGSNWSTQCIVDWVGITEIHLFWLIIGFEEGLFG